MPDTVIIDEQGRRTAIDRPAAERVETAQPVRVGIRIPITVAADEPPVPAIARPPIIDVPEMREVRSAGRDVLRNVLSMVVFASIIASACGTHFFLEWRPFPGSRVLGWISIAVHTCAAIAWGIRAVRAEVRQLRE